MTGGRILQHLTTEVHKRGVDFRTSRCFLNPTTNGRVVNAAFVTVVVLEDPIPGEDTRTFAFHLDTRRSVLDSGKPEKYVKGKWQVGSLPIIAKAVDKFLSGRKAKEVANA
jgi:hypothetical protein